MSYSTSDRRSVRPQCPQRPHRPHRPHPPELHRRGRSQLAAWIAVAGGVVCFAGAPLVHAVAAQPSSGARGTTYGAPYIDALTWTEVRDAIAAGHKTVIIPIGGTEQNGPHMVLGKHNYIVHFAAGVMAERLGNTLVAPVIQYVPQGNYNSQNFASRPGVISNPAPSYNLLLDAAVRSLRVHGFTDIILIGDSGGNQSGMTAVADSINRDWSGSGYRVFALTDYYSKGRADLRAWLQSTYGYAEGEIGTHAGITDTSQLMYIFPQGIRTDRILPQGGSPTSGVNGDPTKATAEIGKRAIDFKVEAGIAQYRAIRGGR